MSIINALWPWPWKLVESGSPPHYDYAVYDAVGGQVVSYMGVDAKAKAECIMELRAQKAVWDRARQTVVDRNK